MSQTISPVRYGDGSISNLTELSHKVNLSLTGDLSGQVYVPTTDTFFTVHNNQNVISEIDRTGALIRTITCSSCGDTEDITLISSTSDGSGGYNHTFMISTEAPTSNNLIFRVTIGMNTTTVNASDSFNTGISSPSNDGLESIAYDQARNQFYVALEGDSTPPARLYKVVLPGSGQNATSTQICTNLGSLSTYVNDISGLDYSNTVDNKLLYVLSHESDKMYQIDITDTANCGTPAPV